MIWAEMAKEEIIIKAEILEMEKITMMTTVQMVCQKMHHKLLEL
jgi:hypothetical protein